MNLIALSIPAFFVLIAVELVVSRRRGRRVYRFNDAVTDLGCGIGSQLMGLAFVAIKLLIYVWVYENIRVFELSEHSAWTLVLTVVLMDLIYYWWHRLSHEVNALWAAHIVHHQSEDYNLAVALRQAWLTHVTLFPFYLPLAVLGVPPLTYLLSSAIVMLYQFWIHTELIGRLGPLEWILNTPSHHRVHHAINPEYLDRNYAGIFIVWDRIFGSFAPERAKPTYGITKPLRSFNPVWANVHRWVEMFALARRAPRRTDKLRVLLAPPRWVPPGGEPAPAPSRVSLTRPKYDPQVSRGHSLYVGFQLLLTSLGTLFVLFHYKEWSSFEVATAITLLIGGTLVSGGLMEHKRWAWPLEGVRVVLAGLAMMALG